MQGSRSEARRGSSGSSPSLSAQLNARYGNRRYARQLAGARSRSGPTDRLGDRFVRAHELATSGPHGDVDGPLRTRAEAVTDRALDDVRVYQGPAANRAAEIAGARAYASGRDIVLSGQATAESLNHELAHTAQAEPRTQQASTPSRMTAAGGPSEREASRIARHIGGQQPPTRMRPSQRVAPGSVARDPTNADYLPGAEPWAELEQVSLQARSLSLSNVVVATGEGETVDGGRVHSFTVQGIAATDEAGIRSATSVTITEHDPGGLGTPTYDPEFGPGLLGPGYPIEVEYTRVIAYIDTRGQHVELQIRGWLGFTPEDWYGSIFSTTQETPSFETLLHKSATAGRCTITASGEVRLGDFRVELTNQERTIAQQSAQASSAFVSGFFGPGVDPARAQRMTAFLAAETMTGEQYSSLHEFLTEAQRAQEDALREEYDPELVRDVARVKSILLEEWIDGDDEQEMMDIVRRWAERRDVLTTEGRTYLDAFLHELRTSGWRRDYGLWSGSYTSYYDSLFEEVEEKRGELLGIIARNSREYGNYSPTWDPNSTPNRTNPEITDRASQQVLDALTGWTTDADEQIVADTLTGVGGPTQSAVLRQMMARHDESDWTGLFGRYGEAWGGGMLYWLFEDLSSERGRQVGESLQANQVFSQATVDQLRAGRGWGGKYLPWTTYQAQQATEFYAELANEGNPLGYVGGFFSSLWLPETAGSTITVLTGARLAPALAATHPYVEAGMLTIGTGMSSYQMTIHGQELLTGQDPYTGRELSDEEMIASALLFGSSALFTAAGFAQAPSTQVRLYEHWAPSFGPVPEGWEVAPLEVEPFTQPGQRVLEPFAGQGRQLIRHIETGEVVEISGTARGEEFVATRLSTGDRLIINRGGQIRIPGPALPSTAGPSGTGGVGSGAGGSSGAGGTGSGGSGSLVPSGPGGLRTVPVPGAGAGGTLPTLPRIPTPLLPAPVGGGGGSTAIVPYDPAPYGVRVLEGAGFRGRIAMDYLYGIGARSLDDLHDWGISNTASLQRLELDSILSDRALMRQRYPDFAARVEGSVPGLWESSPNVEFDDVTGVFEDQGDRSVIAQFTDDASGDMVGYFERAIVERAGEPMLDFRMNFLFGLPTWTPGGDVEMVPGRGTPTHMAVTFQMMRQLGLRPGELGYARGKQIQNLETAARVAQLRAGGASLEEAMLQTHSHRYITDTLRQLGYDAELIAVETDYAGVYEVQDIAFFGANRAYWEQEIAPGRTRLDDLLDRYGLTLDSELEMDWNIIYRLTPISSTP